MASFNIHLAVAKRYIDKNIIKNKNDFFNGTIDPDLEAYEETLHYTMKNRNKNNLIKYLKGKVSLSIFLAENEIDTDYNKGVFLHLITDHLFFNEFFEKDYLKKITYDEFVKDLYYSYDLANQYLLDKYGINLDKYRQKIDINIKNDKKNKKTNNFQGTNILDFNKLDIFIEQVSNINLEEYRKEIMS